MHIKGLLGHQVNPWRLFSLPFLPCCQPLSGALHTPRSKAREEETIMTEKQYYSVREMAEILSLSRQQVYNLLAQGEVPCVHCGKSKR